MTVSFNAQMAQLGGMIRYEFLMLWRYKTMLILLFPLLLISGMFILTSGAQMDTLRANVALTAEATTEVNRRLLQYLMGGTWIAFSLVLMYIAPFGAADSIPKDQQIGVRELLDSLPLSSRIYMAGKLFGLWGAILAALGLYALITVIVCRIAVGPFDVVSYLGMWVLVGGSVVLVHTGIVQLLAAGQSTRRGAIIVAVIAAVGMLLVVSDTFSLGIKTLDYFNPNQPVLTKYFLFRMVPIEAPLITTSDILSTIGASFLELAIVAVGVWWWMRRQRDM